MFRFISLLFSLFFPLFLANFSFSQTTEVQAPDGLVIDSSDLHFYLVQAFQAETANERIELNHIGIQVVDAEDAYVVSAVLEGYPAHRAGINRGDKILTVNEAPFHPVYSFNDATNDLLFAEKEDQYDIKLERNGESLTVRVAPVFENLFDSYRTASLNSIQQFSLGNKVIGYVRIWGLSRTTNDLIAYRNQIRQLSQCDGLILDLRNAYGFLDINHLDLLSPNRNKYFEQTGQESLNLNEPSLFTENYRRPIAILINATTQAGAELLAYQLNKLEHVLTLGETTGGRIGSYRLESIGDVFSFRYQPSLDTLIDGKPFESKGVSPEQPVAYPVERTTRSDPQFEAAVNALLGII